MSTAVERDPDTLMLFIEESQDTLQQIERLLLDAEDGNPAPDLLEVLFRGVHTIKGTSGFLQLTLIRTLSHAAEDLMACLRDKSLPARKEHFSLLVSVTDTLRKLIECVQHTGEEDDTDISPLVDALRAALQAKDEPAAPPPVAAAPPPVAVAPPPVVVAPPPVVAPPVAAAPEPVQAEPAAKPEKDPPHEAKRGEAQDGTVRVSVGLLDRLMNLIGELVLVRNQILQGARALPEGYGGLYDSCQNLNLITSELQEQAMKTRMQPVSRVFEKLPRMVRDLCRATGKQAVAEVEGNATEIDKALVEAIRDPVMHIVRNALDHGIEPPELRASIGKNPVGKLSVRASHEGGMVTIEIADDGRGMDPNKLRNHAVNKGIISAADAKRLSDRQALELIFWPGFSTAEKVSDISGRGVGMDVVRTAIERTGGQVDIESQIGKGSSFRLKMPLTMAIIPALLVRAGGQRFAIPQVNLLELVLVQEDDDAIERIRNVELYRLRGELLPLVRLRDAMKMPPHEAHGPVQIVVVSSGGRRYGLIVDEVLDTEEIVIKPLLGQLKRLSCYAGVTILGDGDVALILDVAGLSSMVGLDSEVSQPEEEDPKAAGPKAEEHFLVFTVSGDQCAVPLDAVARLEVMPARAIERIAGVEVVQYRDEIMSIVRLESLLRRPPSTPDREQPMIVFDFGRPVAVAVGEILDIVSLPVSDKLSADLRGELRGVTAVRGRATMLIEPTLVRRLLEEKPSANASEPAPPAGRLNRRRPVPRRAHG